jgi:hypothetical protein
MSCLYDVYLEQEAIKEGTVMTVQAKLLLQGKKRNELSILFKELLQIHQQYKNSPNGKGIDQHFDLVSNWSR